MIEINNLDFKYKSNGNLIFNDLNLNIKKGEMVSIIGHNGVGKTTLLNLINGYLIPNKGQICIDKSIAKKRSEIFFLFDSGGFYSDMTVKENLNFKRLALGQKTKYKWDNDELIVKFKMKKHLNKYCYELSSGLKKRLSLILGIMSNPTMILLDEPTNAIDPETKVLLKGLLMDLKNNGKTIILVTHDLQFSYELSDRIIILNEGEIVCDEYINYEFDDFQKKYFEYTEENE